MKNRFIGWLLFGILLLVMVGSAVFLGYLTVGDSSDFGLVLGSIVCLFGSMYLSMIKIPDWFGKN